MGAHEGLGLMAKHGPQLERKLLSPPGGFCSPRDHHRPTLPNHPETQPPGYLEAEPVAPASGPGDQGGTAPPSAAWAGGAVGRDSRPELVRLRHGRACEGPREMPETAVKAFRGAVPRVPLM